MTAEISLKDRIVKYLELKYADDPYAYINGGEIEREALIAGYKASNASRRLRELVNEGILVKSMRNGSVEYKYVPEYEVRAKEDNYQAAI